MKSKLKMKLEAMKARNEALKSCLHEIEDANKSMREALADYRKIEKQICR